MKLTSRQPPDGHLQSGGRQLDFRWSTLVILLVAAAVSGVLLTTLVTLWARDVGLLAGGWDFCVYRDGGRHALKDLPLYAKPTGSCKFEYIYPPFAALFFAPLVWLPDGADKFIWLAINVVVLAAIVMLCFRILGYRMSRYVAGISALLGIACAFLEPVRTTLFFGQINLLLMLMVLWDASLGNCSRLKGIGIGVTAGIKLTPAYFVVYYLLLRQWRAAAVAVGTIAATIGLGWLVLPNDSWQYWRGKVVESSPFDKSLFHVANQSVRGGIARLTVAVPPPWLWLGADVCVAGAQHVDRRAPVPPRRTPARNHRCRIERVRGVTVYLEPPLGVARTDDRLLRTSGAEQLVVVDRGRDIAGGDGFMGAFIAP